MSFKEWTAVTQIVSAVVFGGWVIADYLGGGAAGLDMAGIAMKLVWVIVWIVAFNIVAIILVTILVSIARREEMKDEKPDERDRTVADRSNSNGYLVTSIVAALVLLGVAFGLDPIFAVYGLFTAPMLGGVTDAVSRLVYYRIG
jgi:uncharacterized membrane protein